MNSDSFIIARAGWKPLGIALGAFFFFTAVDANFLQFLSGIAAVGIAWLYRNPERIVPYYQSGSIVAVADGIVLSIETVTACELCNEPCHKIEILSGPLDASLLRAPFDGEVKALRIRRGARLGLYTLLAADLNEKATISFAGRNGERMFAEHMLERTPADIVLDTAADHRIAQGGRYGTVTRGKSTLYLPMNCRINLHVGSRVRAGETLVGYFTASNEH